MNLFMTLRFSTRIYTSQAYLTLGSLVYAYPLAFFTLTALNHDELWLLVSYYADRKRHEQIESSN